MTRFHFQVRCRQHLFPDRDGRPVDPGPDLQASLRREAVAFVAASAISLLDDPDCVVEVLDASRTLRASFSVRDVRAT